MCLPQTFAGQDEWMEELLGDEYYVELFAEIAESEPITEAIDEVPHSFLYLLTFVVVLQCSRQDGNTTHKISSFESGGKYIQVFGYSSTCIVSRWRGISAFTRSFNVQK